MANVKLVNVEHVPAEARGPIVIGGLGGSGTRAVARAVSRLNVYMGSSLNEAHDNLWFTLLCKRPAWLAERLARTRPDAEVVAALDLLGAIMTGRELDSRQLDLLRDAAEEQGNLALASEALASRPPADARGWGWKEPNSQVIIPEIAVAFPELVYVHVLRHPLDMAFSANRNQMRLWGPTLGVTESPPHDEANAQLRWWLMSTSNALQVGQALGDRFLVVRFEDYCRNPAESLERICDTMGFSVGPDGIDRATEDVQPQSGTGRWRANPWQQLNPELLRSIAAFGYELPA